MDDADTAGIMYLTPASNTTALSLKPAPVFCHHCTVFLETGQNDYLKGSICSRTKKILVYYNQAHVMIFIRVRYISGGVTQHKELAIVNKTGERSDTVIYRRNHTEITVEMINT